MDKLLETIALTTGYKKSQQETANFIMTHPELFNNLMSICFETKNPEHYKA